MAFVSSHKSRLLVGSVHYSGFVTGVSLDDTTAMLRTTTILDTAHTSIPGVSSATMSVDMLLDTGTSGQFASMTTWKSTPQVVTLLPSGLEPLSEAWLVLGNQSQGSVGSAVDGVVGTAVQVQSSEVVAPGVVLSDLVTVTEDTNGSSRDNGAATSNGGIAHLHVTAYSGLTSDEISIEHSTNGSVWATLATFTTVTGVGSERLTIAAGTTVNRYLRVVDDVTDTGSITRAVAFARL